MSHTAALQDKNTVKFSIPSIIAVASAILSFLSGAIFGLLFALAAIIFGVLGVVLALSPKRRGGVGSTLAVLGGAFGVVAALIKALLWIF